MRNAPSHPRRTPRLRPLAAWAVACALLTGGVAVASSSIDPSSFTTTTGTLWQFIVDHSGRSLNPTCYLSSPRRDQSYSCLRVALQSTGLDKTLRETGPITLFAPTDAGFAELAHLMGAKAFRQLMTQPDKLTELLHNLMVQGRYTSADLKARSVQATGRLALPTLAGTQLELTFSRFTTGAGRVSVRMGPAMMKPAWEPYLVGQTTVLNNGSVIPLDMVYLPASMR